MFVSRHDCEAIYNYFMSFLSLMMTIFSCYVIQMSLALCSSGILSRFCRVLGAGWRDTLRWSDVLIQPVGEIKVDSAAPLS